MKARVLGISGAAAVGKSILSKKLSNRLGWKLISSGQVLQREAARLGLDARSRRVLQDLSYKYIKVDRENFCRKLLESVNWSSGEDIVVDAIRHVEASDTLKRLTAPSEFRLLHITLDESLSRLPSVGGSNPVERVRPRRRSPYRRSPGVEELDDGRVLQGAGVQNAPARRKCGPPPCLAGAAGRSVSLSASAGSRGVERALRRPPGSSGTSSGVDGRR